MWCWGFIGGHLVSKFLKDKNTELICADIKPLNIDFKNMKIQKIFVES